MMDSYNETPVAGCPGLKWVVVHHTAILKCKRWSLSKGCCGVHNVGVNDSEIQNSFMILVF